MTIRTFFLGLLLFGHATLESMANDNYLQQAIAKVEVVRSFNDPVLIRQYTVLITEFYAHQFLFRAFAMRDLRPGENLWGLRLTQDQVTMTESQGLVENNLEDLLLEAQKVFPNDLNIRFAIAQYLYLGRELLPSPVLKMPRETLLETFSQAEKAGIVSATSLYVLALTSLADEKPDAAVMQLLERAHAENRHNPEIMAALGNHAVSMGDLAKGSQFARLLFERAPSPNDKAEALLLTARVFSHRNDCAQVLTAVRASLDLQPRMALSWTLGLDCLRKEEDASSYIAFVQMFLDQDVNDPSLFRIYLDYLQLRGVHAHDARFFETYQKQEPETDLERMTHSTNIGSYYFQKEDWQQAHAAYERALGFYRKLKDAPPVIEQMLTELIAMTQNTQTPKR